MDLSCPWNQFPPGHLAEKFCEESLCAWIKQPSNTWSNLSYILLGLYMLYDTRRKDRPALSASMRFIPFMCMSIGLSSGIYHASLTFQSEVYDLGSMYLFSSLLLTLNMKRLGWLSNRLWTPIYIAINVVSLAALIIHKPIGIDIFAIQCIAGILMEFRLFAISKGWVETRDTRNVPRGDYRLYWISIGLFGLAYGIWNLDYHKYVCDPANHFVQGHAIWHVLNAVVVLTLYYFYRPFDRFFVPSLNLHD